MMHSTYRSEAHPENYIMQLLINPCIITRLVRIRVREIHSILIIESKMLFEVKTLF